MSNDIDYLPSRKNRSGSEDTRPSSWFSDLFSERKKLTLILSAVVLLLAVLAVALILAPDDSRFLSMLSRNRDDASHATSTNGSDEVQYDAEGNLIQGTGGGGGAGGGATGGSATGGGTTGGGSGQTPPTVLPSDIVPHDWINEYFADLMAGRYEAAQQRLPASLRAKISAEQLRNRNESDPVVSARSESNPAKASDKRAEIVSTVTYRSGATSTQTWEFERQGDAWVLVARSVEGMPG